MQAILTVRWMLLLIAIQVPMQAQHCKQLELEQQQAELAAELREHIAKLENSREELKVISSITRVISFLASAHR